jgi:hypothetical protein
MKIVVMWEDPSEEEAAIALANVLPRIAPSLARVKTNPDGTASVRLTGSQGLIRVRARACSDSEEFGGFAGAARAAAEAFAAMTEIPAPIIGPDPRPVKRTWGGQIVQGGQLPRDWSPCPSCGKLKYDGALCPCQVPAETVVPKPKPKPQPKPPSETRDLIFPEDDDNGV